MSGAAERFRPTWAEVDTGVFSHNIDAIVGRLPARARLVAVLKGNAYGHGAVELARVCDADRVAMIAVALLEEALHLRRAGISLPIMVFGPVGERAIVAAVENDITLGVPGPEELALACEVAQSRDVHVHLKLDSGMGRMGVTETELPAVVERIRATPRLHVDGVYTHFANSEDDPEFTQAQIERFDRMRTAIDAPLQHFANSAATMRGLVRPGDLARVGIALYDGVMRWRTEIARLKTLPPGHAIGYGTTFHTTRESRIATLPVGYADGFNRLQSNNGTVLIRGQRAPIVGRVSMDLVTIDLTDVPGAAMGDEVVLLGDGITADEIAARIDTISYEVFCSISARVPRVYR